MAIVAQRTIQNGRGCTGAGFDLPLWLFEQSSEALPAKVRLLFVRRISSCMAGAPCFVAGSPNSSFLRCPCSRTTQLFGFTNRELQGASVICGRCQFSQCTVTAHKPQSAGKDSNADGRVTCLQSLQRRDADAHSFCPARKRLFAAKPSYSQVCSQLFYGREGRGRKLVDGFWCTRHADA